MSMSYMSPSRPSDVAKLPEATSLKGDSHEEEIIIPSVMITPPEHEERQLRKRRTARKFLPWKTSTQEETEDMEETSKKRHPKIPVVSQMKALLFAWPSLLFVFVPAGFAVKYTHQQPVTVFVLNFIAIIPSSAALGFAVEETLSYVGNTPGALISMSFG